MANVDGTFYSGQTGRPNSSPESPPDLQGEQPFPVNPPTSGSRSYINLTDTFDSDYVGKNGFVPVVTDENGLTLEPLPQIQENGLISGGIVQWTGIGYVFNVSSSFYRIGGNPYSTDPVQKTLSTPDATNDRIDVFAVDVNNAVVIIEGTPAPSPVKPQIDPTTQLELTSVIVTAASTEPTLTEEVIYDENIEWTGSSTGTGTVVFNSAVDPFQGSLSIETTNIQNGLKVRLTNSIDVDITTFQTIGFQIKLKEGLFAAQDIGLTFLNSSGDAVSNKTILNVNKSNTDYQFIGIALSTFSFTDNDIRAIEFDFIRTRGQSVNDGFFLDIIKLEGGINPPININSFLGLSDTPITYLGQGGKTVAVKSDESGLEFVGGGGGASTFLDLTDTPSAYTGQAGKFVRVNSTPDALEFDSVSPYDLDQEGATDGQVLTWVNANSRYEPVTPSGGGISGLTTNTIPKATSATTIGDSRLFDDGTSAYFTNQSTNLFFGILAGNSSPLTATGAIAIGQEAGETNSSGSTWTAIGLKAGELNASGSGWTAIGSQAGQNNVSGSFWTAIGRVAGQSATGNNWTAIGLQAAPSPTGSNWVAIGYDCARRYNTNATGANFSNGVYIGFNVRVGAVNAVNEIVIGYATDGIASNTIVIGNASITDNYIRGNFNVTDTRNLIFGTSTGTKIATATSQKLAFWNKTPIIQPTTGITAATFTANTSGIANDTATFGGYTIGQIAQALINVGLLA